MNIVIPATVGAMNMPEFSDPAMEKLVAFCKSRQGKAIEITLADQRKARTLNQNAYYWGVMMKMLAEHTGHTPAEIHDVMRGMFLKRTGWMDKEIVLSTTGLSTVEAEAYYENVRRWAAIALGVSIPLPNEVDIPTWYEKGD